MVEHLIKDIKFVECEICKKHFEKLDNRHFKKHKITLKEYRQKFQNSPTKTKKRYIKDLDDNEKRQKAKKEKNQFVTKKCWNYKSCGNEVDNININVGKILVTCNNCKEKNLFHPKIIEHKNRMSEQAKELNKNPEVIKKRTNTLKNKTDEEKKLWKENWEKGMEKSMGPDWEKILNEKQVEGMLRIHGVKTAFEKNEFVEKAADTLEKRTGKRHAMHVDEYREKHAKSMSNVDWDKVNIKRQKTNIDRSGYNWPTQNPKTVEKAKTTRLDNQIEKVISYLEGFGYKMKDKYEGAHKKYNFKHSCGYTFITSWNYLWNQIQGGIICRYCSPKKTKTKYVTQGLIAKFIEDLGINVINGNRTIIKPYELDIVLPDYNIAIEYCGLFHHCEEVIKDTRKKINDPKKYHLFKKEECEKAGYNLITIFEDEWIHKQSIVKERIKHIINKSNSKRIHGRKCKIFEITALAKNKFLNEFHIQGNDNAKISYGAFYEDAMVAVMTFSYGNISKGSRKKEGVWELNRFCSDYNYHIPGIAGKLLKEFQRKNTWKEIFSFADRRWSNGNLYIQLGFVLDHINPPGYSYIDYKNIKRIHRFAMRKLNEEKDLDMPEWALRLKQGYKRIFDCGTLKFVLKN